MPRGVYDRSKSKAQRAAEKTPKKGPKGAKRKYTKRAVQETGGTKVVNKDNGFLLMQEARANLAVLTGCADKFGALPSLKTEIEAHVGIISQLREKLFATDDDVEIEVDTPNGTSQQQSQVTQSSVPLPPAVSLPVPPTPTH